MSVTCYNPLPQDILEASEALFGTTEYVLDKQVFRYYIFKYCDYKGYSDYSNYKNNVDDFYNFIKEHLQLNVEFDTGVIDKINEYALAIPQIVSEIPKTLVNDTLDALNSIIEDSDFKFQAVKLQNGNYKILLPSQVYTEEMLNIKKESLLNGTFKLAPNGNTTNLTERQWLHVRTKAFKEWFGDWENDPTNASKVVDENSEPLVVYHGSKNQFNTFDFSKTKKLEGGFYFTSDRLYAKNYGTIEYPVFLNIKNPTFSNDINNETTESFIFSNAQQSFFNPSYIPYDGIVGKDTVTGEFEHSSTGIEYVVIDSPNQIKSATDNIGSYSRENNDIQKSIITEQEYNDMLDELSLVEDKTDSFLYNYMKKVLNVNPRYKVNEDSKTLVTDFIENKPLIFLPEQESLKNLTSKIFGYKDAFLDFSKSKYQFIKDLNSLLDNWENDLIDAVNNPIDINYLYEERNYVKNKIDLLQRFLNYNLNIDSFTKEEDKNTILSTISSIESKEKLVTKQRIGYIIHKLKKSYYNDIPKAISVALYKRNSMLLAAKNRLVALNTIEGLKDIVKKRLLAEYNSRTVKDSTYKEKIRPYISLYNAIQNTINSKNKESLKNTLFSSAQEEAISFEQLYDTIKKQYPQYSDLLNMFKKANPNLKIFVGGDPKQNVHGNIAGYFNPRNNELHLSNIADIYTIIHELAHSATYYGIIGNEEGHSPFSEKIEEFMQYIRNYVDSVQVGSGTLSPVKIFGVDMPASVYGFTNPSEFIAELFGNPKFQELLSEIPAMESKKFKSLLHEIWDSIVEFFNSLLGKQKMYKSALDQAKELGYASMFLQQKHISEIYESLSDIADENQNSIVKNGSKKQSMLDFVKSAIEKKESKGFEDFDNFTRKVKNIVTPHEDFRNNHIYLIDGVPAQTSVTKFIDDPNYENPKKEISNSESNKFKSAALAIGDSIDAAVREFFENGDKINKNNKNIPKKVLDSLENQLIMLRKQLDNHFGTTKYKVISQEINIPGNITYTDKDGNTKIKSIVGTPDLIVVSEFGDYFIVDVKTVNNSTINKNTLNKYKKQVKLYKDLMYAYTKDSSLKHKGNFILQISMQYEDTQDYAFNDKGQYVSKEGGLLKDNFDNVDDPISIKKHKTSSIGYFLDINGDITNEIETVIDAYNIKELTPQEVKEIVQTGQVSKEIIVEEKKKADKIIKQHTKEIENKNTIDDIKLTQDVLTASEISKIGKTIVKLFCYHINILSKDSQKFQKILKIDLGNLQGMPADNIIRLHYKDLSIPLLKYISKKFFNIDNLEIDSPEYNKMAYIKKNIQTIFNRNFAEFQDIEKISVKYNISEDLEGQYSEGLLDTLEEDSREPYFIDSKEVSFLESMPARLKREFSLIPHCDRDLKGNIIYVNGYPKIELNKEGLPEFYEKNEVILNILEGVHHMRSIDDMLKYLKESEEVYCRFIYNKLKDNKQLQSIFYRTFRKNKTVYYKSSFGKNSSITMLEDLVTRKYYMDYASSYLNGLLQGIVLSDNGVFSSIKGQLFVNIEKVKRLQLQLRESKNQNSEVKKQIKALHLPNFKVKYNNIGDFTSALYRFYGNVISKTNKDTSEIGLNDLIEKCYDILVKTLLPYAEKHYEMTVYDNGKTYAVYTEPTFIQDLIEDIQQNRFQETPQGNPDNWQFCRKTAEGDIYVNSFYEVVKDDDKLRSVVKHCKKTTTNDTTYQEMNSHDYLCSIIQDYFCTFNKMYLPNIPESQAKKMRLYRMPIMSDKPTQESVMFPVVAGIRSSRPKYNYDLDEMKTGVARKTFEYFLLELQRMRHLINIYNESDSGIAQYNLKSNIDNSLKEKILKGQKKQKYQFKLSDFVDTKNGTWKPFLKGTGFGFWFLSEFNDILKSNDENSEILKEAIIQYINTGDLGKADNTGIVEDSFREKFVSIMDFQYQIFKEGYFNPANENSKYKKTIFKEGQAIQVDSDFLTEVVPGEKEELKDAYLQEFFYNDYIGTLNILNMTVVDPAFFKDTIDLQKRFAQVHSSTVKPNKDAEFRASDGSYKKYSDGKHRFIVINDVEKPSVLKEQVRNVFKQKAEQFEELYKKDKSRETLLKAQMYRKLENTVPELFKDVTTTDGQSFSTPTGAWKKRGMLGEDTANEFKFVLDEIRKGNYGALVNYSNTMSQVFKSFTASIVEDVENKGTYKPMQLKDSEAMLLAIEIFKKEGFESPLNAIYEVLEASHYNFAIDENKKPLHNDETYSDHGIDLAVFKSAVKEGSQKELSIEGKTYEQVKKELENYIKEEKFHVNSFDHWGQQQNTPQHFYNSTSDLGSQVRILPVADMPEDFSTEIEVDGKNVKMDKKQFLQHYFTLLSEDFNAGIQKVIDDLGLNNDKSNKAYNLKKKVIDSIMKDSKQTLVILDAVDNHSTESTIIGDPDIASKVYSTVFSKIKKDVNKQNFLGGSVIQASDIATNSNLHVRDSKGRTPQDKGFDLSKGKVTMDIMVTAYDEQFLHKITFNAFNKKLFERAGLKHSYKTGDIIQVKDLLQLGILTEDELKMIGYRIPTEDKYSCFCFNIVGFLPLASGEQIMVPYEAVGLAGFDFDIKLYWCH